jgi:hypothetical protein
MSIHQTAFKLRSKPSGDFSVRFSISMTAPAPASQQQSQVSLRAQDFP